MSIENETKNASSQTGVILVLTCPLSPPERMISARRQIIDLFPQSDFRVIDGFTGNDPIVDSIADHFKMALFTKRPMTPNEIATYATHRLAWETLVASDAPFALVLEDDFHFASPETVVKCFETAKKVFETGCDMLKLFDFPRAKESGVAVVKSVADLTLVKWKRPRAGTVGYLLSRQGAEKLLKRKKIFRVVDEDIKFYWELGLDIWSIPNNPITDASLELGGSLLEDDRMRSKHKSIRGSLKGLVLTASRSLRNRLEFKKYADQYGLKHL